MLLYSVLKVDTKDKDKNTDKNTEKIMKKNKKKNKKPKNKRMNKHAKAKKNKLMHAKENAVPADAIVQDDQSMVGKLLNDGHDWNNMTLAEKAAIDPNILFKDEDYEGENGHSED
jgi:hypothetical protein